MIPPQASVAASTPLIPHLANREVLVRFPNNHAYLDRQGKPQPVEWIAVDFDWLRPYAVAFRRDRGALRSSLGQLRELQGTYGVQRVLDGVVVLQLHRPDQPDAHQELARITGMAP